MISLILLNHLLQDQAEKIRKSLTKTMIKIQTKGIRKNLTNIITIEMRTHMIHLIHLIPLNHLNLLTKLKHMMNIHRQQKQLTYTKEHHYLCQ